MMKYLPFENSDGELLNIKSPRQSEGSNFMWRIPDSNRWPLACQASALAN